MKENSPNPFRFCVVIPFYNHGTRVVSVVQSLEQLETQIYVVNDGSTEVESIQALSSLSSHVTVCHKDQNEGKGSALAFGFRKALEDGFTHAVCVDADGQHSASDVPSFISKAREYPHSLILGVPQFGEDAPWERVHGRKLSTLFVRLETRSRAIRDVLYGFRVYPLAETVPLLADLKFNRMGFDVECLVRFVWAGGSVEHVMTPVLYPEDGRSHFHYIRDNIEMVKLHTLLLSESVIQLSPRSKWFDRKERGSSFLFRVLVSVYGILGRRIFSLLLYPLAFFYLLLAGDARRASVRFYEQVLRYRGNGGSNHNEKRFLSPLLFAFRNFHLFARSMLDSVRAWRKDIAPKDLNWIGMEVPNTVIEQGIGALVLTAHFGPVEASRALHRQREGHELLAIMYLKNAMKFRRVLDAVAPSAHDDVIEVAEMNMASVGQIQRKLNEGAFVGLMGDRLSPNTEERKLELEFLGSTAYFPEGPFLLASLLQVPVLAVLSFYEKDQREFSMEWRRIEVDSSLSRDERVYVIARSYLDFLEERCQEYPEQFFNFFNIWENP